MCIKNEQTAHTSKMNSECRQSEQRTRRSFQVESNISERFVHRVLEGTWLRRSIDCIQLVSPSYRKKRCQLYRLKSIISPTNLPRVQGTSHPSSNFQHILSSPCRAHLFLDLPHSPWNKLPGRASAISLLHPLSPPLQSPKSSLYRLQWEMSCKIAWRALHRAEEDQEVEDELGDQEEWDGKARKGMAEGKGEGDNQGSYRLRVQQVREIWAPSSVWISDGQEAFYSVKWCRCI